MHLAEAPVKAKLNGTCTAGTSPDLTGYPHLVYAPAQWGEGVRVAGNGELADSVAVTATVWPIDRVAENYKVSLYEVVDALRYARANGLID